MTRVDHPPQMESLAENVWHVPGPAVRMPGGVLLPVSSTVLRLPDRSLVIYSPIEFPDVAEIEALGNVAHLVAPNLYHHLYLAKAAERWPHALIHAAPGLSAKQPSVGIHKTLGTDDEPTWQGTIDVVSIQGVPKINETVLFHRPSGTLLVADLLFHVTEPANVRTRLVLSTMGVGKRLAQSRYWSLLRKDRTAARASVERILAWPIQRIAPCHGPAVGIDAPALAPLLKRLAGPLDTQAAAD